MKSLTPFLLLLLSLPLVASENFEEYSWQSTVSTGTRLCEEASANAAGLIDKINIACDLEGQDLTRSEATPKTVLKVAAWNIERGYKRSQITRWLAEGNPDIIILSEVDRGCRRTGYQQVARYIASQLGMYYVYGVEFVEVNDHCEHGNAILSRYPIGNVELIRYKSASSRYVYNPDDELRVGGRMALSADIQIGDKQVRVYSTHLASHFKDTKHRHKQAEELAKHQKPVTTPVIIGGDFNTHTFFLEARFGLNSTYVLRPLYKAGLEDVHGRLSASDRVTHPGKVDTIIDFLFQRGASSAGAGVCDEASCRGLSDHLPIWTTITLP